MREATVKPKIPSSMLPVTKPVDFNFGHQPNVSRRRTETPQIAQKPSISKDDFGDEEIDDDTLVKASFADLDFDQIENYADPNSITTQNNTSRNSFVHVSSRAIDVSAARNLAFPKALNDQGLTQLPSGKWACNHPCKDKEACKHLCCKTGIDRPPKKKATKTVHPAKSSIQIQINPSAQDGKIPETKLQFINSKRKMSDSIEELDLSQQEKRTKTNHATRGLKDFRNLHQLHKNTQSKGLPASLHSIMHKKPSHCYTQDGKHDIPSLGQESCQSPTTSSDYGDIKFDEVSALMDEMPVNHTLLGQSYGSEDLDLDKNMDHIIEYPKCSYTQGILDSDNSLMENATMVTNDSQQLKFSSDRNSNETKVLDQGGYELDSFQEHPESPERTCGITYAPEQLYSTPALCYNPSEISIYRTEVQRLDDISDFANVTQISTSAEQQKATSSHSNVDNNSKAIDQDIMPETFRDLEPWLFQQFGDIVELVED